MSSKSPRPKPQRRVAMRKIPNSDINKYGGFDLTGGGKVVGNGGPIDYVCPDCGAVLIHHAGVGQFGKGTLGMCQCGVAAVVD
jgi:hypothetical protein